MYACCSSEPGCPAPLLSTFLVFVVVMVVCVTCEGSRRQSLSSAFPFETACSMNGQARTIIPTSQEHVRASRLKWELPMFSSGVTSFSCSSTPSPLLLSHLLSGVQ